MSIATEITRLQNAKSDLKTSINNKLGTIISTQKLDSYDDAINGVTIQVYRTGTSAPASSLGNDGDIYLQLA